MKKIIKIIPFFLFGLVLANQAHAFIGSTPLIKFVRSGNGNMFTCPSPNSCNGTASTTAPLSFLEVSAGFFNNPTNNNAYATLYNASGTVILATSTIANFPSGTYATTTVVFPYPYTVQTGIIYQIGWTPVDSAGELIDENNSQIGYFDGNAGQVAPEMSLLYPENSSSTFIHDFTHFTFSATNTDYLTHDYYFSVIYDTTSTFTNTPVSISRNLKYTFSPQTGHFLNIPKPQPLASSTEYWAKLCYQSESQDIPSCNDPIVFEIGQNPYGYQVNTETAGFFGSTTTEVGILYPKPPIISNPAEYCDVEFYNPASWACWAWYKTGAVIDYLGNRATEGIKTIASTSQVVFPINIIYEFNADLNAVSATTTDMQLALVGQNSAYKKPAGGYYTFTLLTTSTIKQSETATGFNWEQFVIYIIYGATGLLILATAFVLIHDSSRPPSA